jgi:predicted nucleic acid-binding protein
MIKLFPPSIRRRRTLTDTSAYLALLDRDDANHLPAQAALAWLSSEGYRQYTTNAMLIEAHALVLSVMGNRVANQFLRDVMGSGTVIVRARASDEERARDILFRYEDKVFSYNDALSFAVMERLGIDLAFTFDSDFRQYGWAVVSPPTGGR